MYDAHFSTRKTPVDQPIPGKPMVKNTDGGGYVFAVNDLTRFERFLILGSEGGSYYASERELTVENAQAALRLFAQPDSGMIALGFLVGISQSGRAPRNEPALFALAMATASPHVDIRRKAWESLPLVARTGTHLFQFAQYRQAFGGWGPLTRKGIGAWYTAKTPRNVAFQMLKYQQREGWSHRDLLRLSHAQGSPEHNAIFSAVTHPTNEPVQIYGSGVGMGTRLVRETRTPAGVLALIESGALPPIFKGVQIAAQATTAAEVASAIETYDLQREMIPTLWHTDPQVLVALFQKQPMTAMIRNLGNLSKAGVLAPFSDVAKEVCARLTDETRIEKARLHPLQILMAQRTYGSGHGRRGKGEWTVTPQVVAALEECLTLSFKYAPKTGKRWLLGVDVSSSMGAHIGDTGISSCEMAALMALVIAKQESDYFIAGFAHTFKDLKITAKDTFASACKKAYDSNFGSTQIDLPMTYALQKKIPVDVFMVMTDNEVNRGTHPAQALVEYRQKMGLNSKLVVCAFTASEFSVADPSDAGMLDVAGLDTNVPMIVADFATK